MPFTNATAKMVKVNIDFAKLATHNQAKAKRFVQVASLAGENELKNILGPNPSRSGRQYKRGQKTHTASAPGEAPAIDTGRLRQSVASTPPRKEGRSFVAETGMATEYAEKLELGTERIAPRPSVSLLAHEKRRREKIVAIATEAIRD